MDISGIAPTFIKMYYEIMAEIGNFEELSAAVGLNLSFVMGHMISPYFPVCTRRL